MSEIRRFEIRIKGLSQLIEYINSIILSIDFSMMIPRTVMIPLRKNRIDLKVVGAHALQGKQRKY